MNVIQGEEAVNLYRMKVLQKGLELEIKGMQKRGKSMYTIIKQQYGLKGCREDVLTAFKKLIEEKEAEFVANHNQGN